MARLTDSGGYAPRYAQSLPPVMPPAYGLAPEPYNPSVAEQYPEGYGYDEPGPAYYDEPTPYDPALDYDPMWTATEGWRGGPWDHDPVPRGRDYYEWVRRQSEDLLRDMA